MQNKLTITYFLLLVMTITTAILSSTFKTGFSVIIIIAILKFWLVTFMFMDIRKAHVFWKSLAIIWGAVMFGFIIALT